MAGLKQAVEFAAAGDWQAAHRIVQKDSSTHGAWLHGIVHVMEGDLGNADYWYQRAGRKRPDPPDVDAEIATLRAVAGL